MKKNKFFTGVLVLLFVLSFSVSQVLLAGNSIQNPVECPEGGDGGGGNSFPCVVTIVEATGFSTICCVSCQRIPGMPSHNSETGSCPR